MVYEKCKIYSAKSILNVDEAGTTTVHVPGKNFVRERFKMMRRDAMTSGKRGHTSITAVYEMSLYIPLPSPSTWTFNLDVQFYYIIISTK